MGSDRRPEDVSTSFEHQFDDPDDKFNSAGDQVDTQVLKIGGWGGFVSGYRARTKLEFENSTCAKDFEKSQIETRRKSEKNEYALDACANLWLPGAVSRDSPASPQNSGCKAIEHG